MSDDIEEIEDMIYDLDKKVEEILKLLDEARELREEIQGLLFLLRGDDDD